MRSGSRVNYAGRVSSAQAHRIAPATSLDTGTLVASRGPHGPYYGGRSGASKELSKQNVGGILG